MSELAVIMTLVILWGVADVVWVLYNRLIEPPYLLLTISDNLQTFGVFIAVMIAIEIFENSIVYLHDEVIHVELEMGYVWATGGGALALGLSYWLIVSRRGASVNAPSA